MDPSLLCKVFFSLGAAVDIGGVVIPTFREGIMDYGSRSTDSTPPKAREQRTTARRMFDRVASLQVPHTWFTHYYVISLASSIFWGYQIFTDGQALKFLALNSHQTTPAMTKNQVIFSWLLMAIQGGRRLYESIIFTKPSVSKMWIGLWIIGSVYYVVMGVTVWIEGIPTLNGVWSLSDLDVSRPSNKTIFAMPLFLLASTMQHTCHKHLASLKKYSLPRHPLFQWVVCPHYFFECLVYVAIAVISAPRERLFNRTVLAGIAFVVTNLAVTADSTRNWYARKFGEVSVARRWRMIPYVF